MLLLSHGQYFIVAQLHISEADKYTVGYGTVPHLRVGQRPETNFIKVWFHVQQQAAAGYEINLQDKPVQRSDR